MPDSAHHLRIPFHAPFTTASGEMTHREVILVRVDAEGTIGWGEAAPWPGQTADSLDDVWRTLTGSAEAPTAKTPAAGANRRSPTAQVALAVADADAAARRDGIPLHGSSPAPLPAVAAIGMADDERLAAAVDRIVDVGFGAVKLKIAPGRDTSAVATVRSRSDDMVIHVDANGSYQDAGAVPRELADLGVASLEQPLPPSIELKASRAVADRLGLPVVVDESVRSADDADAAIEAGLVPCIKVARLGIDVCRRVADDAASVGAVVKLSGMFETSVGKAATIALGAHPAVTFIDLAPTAVHLAGDVVDDPWHVVDGMVWQRSSPGLGVEVDAAAVARYRVRAAPIVGR